MVEQIQKYCTRLREATTFEDYLDAHRKCVCIYGTRHFSSRGQTEEDIWDSVVPIHDLAGVSNDVRKALIEANKIPYNSRLAIFSPQNRITHRMYKEMQVRVQNISSDGSVYERVSSLNLQPSPPPTCISLPPSLKESAEAASERVSESTTLVSVQASESNASRLDDASGSNVIATVSENAGAVVAGLRSGESLDSVALDVTVSTPLAFSVPVSRAPSVASCSLEEAVENAQARPMVLEEPVSIEFNHSPLSNPSQPPRSESWGRECSVVPESQGESESASSSQNSEPEIGQRRHAEWDHVYRYRDSMQCDRPPPAPSVSSWSVRCIQDSLVSGGGFTFNRRDDGDGDPELAAALQTPVRDPGEPHSWDVSSPHGGQEDDSMHDNAQDDLPMYNESAFEPQAEQARTGSDVRPNIDFSLSGDAFGSQQQPVQQEESQPSVPVLPSIPALNVDAVHQQVGFSQMRQNLEALSRQRQTMSSMQLRRSLNITRAPGGRNMHWVEGREESVVPALQYPPPQMPVPASVFTDPVHPVNQGVNLSQTRVSGETSISMPLKRGRGRPWGFRPDKATCKKQGRPFGSKNGASAKNKTKNSGGRARQQAEPRQHPVSRQTEQTPLTPSLVNTMGEEPPLSEYELLRRQNIAHNRQVLADSGIESDARLMQRSQQQREPRQPRMLRNVVTLNSVFVPGRYEGECPGWVYDRKHLGYFKEAINSKISVLAASVVSRQVYKVNGLFRRYEVVRPLGDEVVSEGYLTNQISGQSVFDTLVQDTGCKIFRRGGNFRKVEINRYLKIDWERRNDGLLDIGNFKYCRGLGEALLGVGLYVKYFKEDDFSVLCNVYPDLRLHYAFRAASDDLPAGYYYHDRDDAGFSKRYDCVHVAPKVATTRVDSESGGDSDDVG